MKEGKTGDGNLAEGVSDKATISEILYKNVPLTLTFNSSLTELQLMIVMAHEYTHLELLEKSRTAGSSNEFALKEPELLSAINNSSEPTDWGKINDGHHEYMGSHVERWKNVYEVLSPVRVRTSISMENGEEGLRVLMRF